MLLFQFKGVAETFLSAGDFTGMRRWAGHPDVDAVIEDLKADDSLTPGLNYYRANVPPESFLGGSSDLPPVEAPTMGVWSSRDFALTETQMVDSERYVAGEWRYERIEGVGHWMQLEAPDQVNRLLIDFLPA
jgi:pimeloyl-ACP methyl ester carboxylesterase